MNRFTATYNIENWNTEFRKNSWSNYFTVNEHNAYAQKRSTGSLVARYLIKKILVDEGICKDYQSIEILNEPSGKPKLIIDGATDKLISNIHISLSHSKTDVAVLVLIE